MEGPNAINLKTIMAQTGAQIVFPEANDPIIPVLKKSSVTLSGNIDSVYLARQMLVVSWISFSKKKNAELYEIRYI